MISVYNTKIGGGVFFLVALLFLSCGGKGLPVEEFAPVIRSHPTSADVQFNLGIARTMLEQEDKAVERFREAVRLNPNDTEAWFQLGVGLSILENEEESAAAFQTALRVQPKVTKHFKLGLAYFTVGRYEDAVREFQLAIAAHESHPIMSHMKLGMAYRNMGNTAAAMEQYTTLKSIDENAANILAGYFHEKNGK